MASSWSECGEWRIDRWVCRFQYEPETLKGLMFPKVASDLVKANAHIAQEVDAGPSGMSVDEDASVDKDVSTGSKVEQTMVKVIVPSSATSLPVFRPLVLENGVESFLIEEPELPAENTDQDQRYGGRTLKISVLRRPSAASTPVARTPTANTPVAGVGEPVTQTPSDTIPAPVPVPVESVATVKPPQDTNDVAQAEPSAPAPAQEAALASAPAPLPAVDPTARSRSTSRPAGLEVAQVLAPSLREGNVRFEKDGLVLVLEGQEARMGTGEGEETPRTGSGLKVIVHGWRWA